MQNKKFKKNKNELDPESRNFMEELFNPKNKKTHGQMMKEFRMFHDSKN